MDIEKKIDCPRCGKEMLQVIICKANYSVMVDHCQECGGYWFDRYELDSLLDDIARREGLPFNTYTDDEQDIACPRCGGVMETRLLYDVKVDLCLTCEGLWLDRGELADVQNAYRYFHNTNRMVEIFHHALVLS
ncbi:MAG: zf-TFIIB domain-containing protein [Candidatus Thermoplasmatota archaeon]|nr:zf-TFIIB domain-containing protein [Candidatus Thermoplasmatota archaeon]